MSAPILREALASLFRAGRDASAALTPDEERAIRRHLAMRWGARAATVAVVGLGGYVGATAALSSWSDTVASEPALEDAALPAVAHIPLEGGPQYEHRWGEFTCGDEAPAPHATAPDERLSIDITSSGDVGMATASVTWAAPAEVPVGRSEPVITAGAMEIIAVRDGVVAGTIITQDSTLGWQQFGQSSSLTGHASLAADQFYCISVDTNSGAYIYLEHDLDPGTYEVFAAIRVFATPESVALYQSLESTDYRTVDERAKQKGVEYTPGSRGCRALQFQSVTARACLPDAVPTAQLNEELGTVRLLYDASALPHEFDVTLVSEPLHMVIE
ncbi:hypothetical protein [Demequina sp.]|uniref:hypothetical protein n=1 Tax=Demequina sp. TaxID=2050685 RepID=UPI0025BF00E3|nr:hypothetical protein [Demequina sp.]